MSESTEHLLAPSSEPTSSVERKVAPSLQPAVSGSGSNLAHKFDPLSHVIPEKFFARTLVLCFDGTGDSFDDDNSNVEQLFSLLSKDDRGEQMVYYQSGIGTYSFTEKINPLMAKWTKMLSMAVAHDLDVHVMDGYQFLMQHYDAGDKICLFGFSRGAYTARALAGMIHKVGLLPSGNLQQVPFAYRMFSRRSEKSWKQSTAFKRAFCLDVTIDFVGVWDTVASVGMVPRSLPFTASNSSIRIFRHAVSLDERRAKFQANLYQRSTPSENALGTKRGEMPLAGVKRMAKNMAEHTQHANELEAEDQLAKLYPHERFETDSLQVWFAGSHTDVGGGSVQNDTRHSLARIPLRWMVRQCFLTNCGIRFYSGLLKRIGLEPASLYPEVKTRPPPLPSNIALPPEPHDIGSLTEEQEDLADALCPIYDQLSIFKLWWILEIMPLKQRIQRPDGTWEVKRVMNLGKGRALHHIHESLKAHRTVQTRMERGFDGKPYVPRVRVLTNAQGRPLHDFLFVD